MKDYNENDDKAIDELYELFLGPDTEPIDVVEKGLDYLYDRKYALAEPELISGINKLENMLGQLGVNNESLLARMKTTGFDEVHVFTCVNEYLLDDLHLARDYLKTVQLKLAQGIEETSVEEAYQEWLQKGRELNFESWIWTCLIVTISTLSAIWAYSVSPLYVILPIFLGAIVFIVMIGWMCEKDKRLGETVNQDVIDLARQEGKLL
jgi:hypothetical protein